MAEWSLGRAVERIDRAVRDVNDGRALRAAMLEEIGRNVGFDAYAWLLTDPETEVGSGRRLESRARTPREPAWRAVRTGGIGPPLPRHRPSQRLHRLQPVSRLLRRDHPGLRLLAGRALPRDLGLQLVDQNRARGAGEVVARPPLRARRADGDRAPRRRAEAAATRAGRRGRPRGPAAGRPADRGRRAQPTAPGAAQREERHR